MFIITRKTTLQSLLTEIQADAMRRIESELSGIKSVSDLSDRVKSLREKISKLEIEKSQKDEEFARREREIEHKVGLERKRQEMELAAGTREAKLSVREENLKADRERFTEQMKFHDERFTAEVGYLKDMIGTIMERLPNITADLSVKRGR